MSAGREVAQLLEGNQDLTARIRVSLASITPSSMFILSPMCLHRVIVAQSIRLVLQLCRRVLQIKYVLQLCSCVDG